MNELEDIDKRLNRYKNSKAVNQSLLKSLYNGEKDIKKLWDEPKSHFIVGSLVDEVFSKQVSIETIIEEKIIVTMYPDHKYFSVKNNLESLGLDLSEELDDDILYSCIKSLALYPKNWKKETILNKFKINYRSLYELSYHQLVNSVLTIKDKIKAERLCELLKHDYIEQLLTIHTYRQEKNIFQADYYFKYKGVECKALLDYVVIDTKSKTIKPYDLKTTSGNFENFNDSIFKYGYYIQAAWYKEALEYNFPGYKVEPMTFIVVSMLHDKPYIKTLHENTMTVGKFGYTDPLGKETAGFDSMFDKCKSHNFQGNGIRYYTEKL